MSGVLSRAGALFLAPDTTAAPRPVVAPPATRFAVVLACPELVDAAAGGVAAALRKEARARTAVVCGPDVDRLTGPALPAAAGLARRLAALELMATATGSVCRVALEVDRADAADAARATWQVVASVDVPVVLALPGRLDGYDDVLAQADHLVLAPARDADPGLTDLATASLAALGPPVACVAPPAAALARLAAARGLAATPLTARERAAT